MKPIPNHDGYFATKDGDILSTRSGSLYKLCQRIASGYKVVTIKVGRKRCKLSVHRLVAMAFHGMPLNTSLEVRHLNGHRMDNYPSNLAWGTRLENVADAIKHGTLGKGMRARRRKLNDDQVVNIKNRYKLGESAVSIASEFCIHPSYVYQLNKGRHWSHV